MISGQSEKVMTDHKMLRACSFLLASVVAMSGVSAREAQNPSNSAETAKKTEGQDTKKGLNEEYKIGPLDVLRIDVWKEPEITRSVPVRPDGKISLPLLNDIQAAGLTSMELAANIAEGLKKYITNPQVTVSVSENNSQRIYVMGEVLRPGHMPLLPNMTVLQALSSCGGFTQFAKIKAMYVLRKENGTERKIPFNYKEAIKGEQSQNNVQLQPGDVIVVP